MGAPHTFAAQTGLSSDPLQVEAAFRQLWGWGAGFFGYQGGLARLFFAMLEPIWLVLQWLFLALAAHGAARWLGGTGTLVQTLGTTALAAAPHLLGLLTVIPFVSVSGLLLAVWSLLIAYRAIAISHDLSWQRAALAVITVPALLILLSFFLAAATTVMFAAGGGA